MTRPARVPGQHTPSRLFFRLAVLCLLILAVPPIRFTWWARSFSSIADLVFAPVGHPVRWIASKARGPAASSDDPAMARLRDEREQWHTMYLQSEAENDRLRNLIAELKVTAAFNSHVPVRQVRAGVYSSASDVSGGVLKVRAGEREGVYPNSVAVVAGLQLLGRVTDVDSRSCSVTPITSKSSGEFRARVILDDNGNGPATLLMPVGDGTFRGDVEYQVDANNEPLEPVVGQIVRLSDDRWPLHAQMLIVGVVDEVEPSPNNPKRKRVTVRPTLDRMDQVSEVILRVTPPEGDAPASRRGGS